VAHLRHQDSPQPRTQMCAAICAHATAMDSKVHGVMSLLSAVPCWFIYPGAVVYRAVLHWINRRSRMEACATTLGPLDRGRHLSCCVIDNAVE
jgi:hypothetical protein